MLCLVVVFCVVVVIMERLGVLVVEVYVLESLVNVLVVFVFR